MLSSILQSSPLFQSVGLARGGGAREIVTLEAGDDDMGDVADLHAESFSPAWSEDEVLRLSRRPGGAVWVAREEGRGHERPLGFLILSRVADEAEIISVGVSRKARRRGVGGALVRAAVREAQAARCAQLFLEVDEGNAAALALYRGLGFREIGERVGYYRQPGRPASRALVMGLDLR